MAENKTYIYGKHAVKEALMHAPRTVAEVFTDKKSNDAELMALIKKSGVRRTENFPRGVDVSAAHQGVLAEVSLAKLMQEYGAFTRNLVVGPDTSLVLLDELGDPQNVGAVIRSAAAFGVSGILIPEHNQAQVTGAVVKVSAGMAFRVPLVSVGNVNTAVRDLKERGFAVYGLAGEGQHTVTKEAFELPTLFILGNESEGIRAKTRELCDKLLSIPINPRCESLNAAASAAVALYAWSVKHQKMLR